MTVQKSWVNMIQDSICQQSLADLPITNARRASVDPEGCRQRLQRIRFSHSDSDPLHFTTLRILDWTRIYSWERNLTAVGKSLYCIDSFEVSYPFAYWTKVISIGRLTESRSPNVGRSPCPCGMQGLCYGYGHGHGHGVFILATSSFLSTGTNQALKPSCLSSNISNSDALCVLCVVGLFPAVRGPRPTEPRFVWRSSKRNSDSPCFSSRLLFVHLYPFHQLHACETLATMFLQRGPPIAENKSTTHRAHSHVSSLNALP